MKKQHILKILILGTFVFLGSLLSFSVNSAWADSGWLRVVISPQGAIDVGAEWEYRTWGRNGWGSWRGPYASGTTITIDRFRNSIDIQVRGTDVGGYTTPAIINRQSEGSKNHIS